MTALPGRAPARTLTTVTDALQQTLARVTPGGALTTGVALTIVLLAFGAQSGVAVGANTRAQVLLIAVAAGLGAVALTSTNRVTTLKRFHGAAALGGVAALALYTALSIIWSLNADQSWLETNRTLSYFAAFAGAMAVARLVPDRWDALLRGIAVGAVVVCGYALLTKAFPEVFNRDETFARLRAPFGYWNAVGLMAASGVPPLLWLAARRSGHAAVNALAYPGLGIVLVTLLQAYSRGGLLALAIGLIVWFAVVPLRLRAAVALVLTALGSAGVTAWTFSQTALTKDLQPLVQRADVGHQFGILLLLFLVVLLAVGLLIGFSTAQYPPQPRTRLMAGRVVIGVLAAGLAAGVIALAAAPGGIGGQVSSAAKSLTSPSAKAPDNGPGRLTATSSVRARYWDEALQVHQLSPWVGTGAGSYGQVRKRFRSTPLEVQDAHGYVVQTLADLGWIGLGVSLAALAAWIAAAVSALGLRRRDRGLGWDAERVGMATIAVVVLVFGVHSLVDWTWFVPANAVLAMICAGWIAARGPLHARLAAEGPTGMVSAAEKVGMVPRTPSWTFKDRAAAWRPPPARVGAALAVVATAVAVCWAVVQPLRAVHAGDSALARLDAGQTAAAISIATVATRRDPLSPEPWFELAAARAAAGDGVGAEAALRRAIRTQPADPETWRRLGQFRLQDIARAQEALQPFQAAYFLDPKSVESQSDLVKLARALVAAQQAAAAQKAAAEAAKDQQANQRKDQRP